VACTITPVLWQHLRSLVSRAALGSEGFLGEYHFRFGTDKIPDQKQVYPFLWEELLRAGRPFLVAAGIYEESVDEIILAARKRLRAA
jgi:hypothetical protein